MRFCEQCDGAIDANDYCDKCRQIVPPPETIRQRCHEAQSQWSPAEERRRRGAMPTDQYLLRIIPTADVIKSIQAGELQD